MVLRPSDGSPRAPSGGGAFEVKTTTSDEVQPKEGSSNPASLSTSTMTRPAFEELPLSPNHPKGSSWGLWGPNDELGTLNLLTPDVVKIASQEVVTGQVIPLK